MAKKSSENDKTESKKGPNPLPGLDGKFFNIKDLNIGDTIITCDFSQDNKRKPDVYDVILAKEFIQVDQGWFILFRGVKNKYLLICLDGPDAVSLNDMAYLADAKHIKHGLENDPDATAYGFKFLGWSCLNPMLYVFWCENENPSFAKTYLRHYVIIREDVNSNEIINV